MKAVEEKVIILTNYVKLNETMAKSNFQRTMLTFDSSAKVAQIGFHQHIKAYFSHTKLGQLKSQISYENSLGRMSEFFGHMINITATPIND